MTKGAARLRRVADQLQRELAEIVRLELKDPRVGMVTFTDVEVSPDYSHAKVFFTHLGGEAEVAEALAGLQRASGFLRRELAQRVRLRITPELHFVFDESVERGARLSRLIDAAMSGKPAPEDDAAG